MPDNSHSREPDVDAGSSHQAEVGYEGAIGGPGRVTTLPDGTLYVEAVGAIGTRHRLWTATGDWTDLHPVKHLGEVSWIQSNGDLVWAGHRPKDMIISSDVGRTWLTVSPR